MIFRRQVSLVALVLLHAALQIVAFQPLSDESLKSIPDPGSDFDIHTGALLAPILIPRVPGTQGSTKVLQHFVNFFHTQLPQWTLEFQNSTSMTPRTGSRQVPFKNLIATRDPPWTKNKAGDVGRLALVAHYDSKLDPEGFIGATDSAAPCAMLLHAARSLDDALTRKWTSMQADGLDPAPMEADKGLQIIFLDGEEAFAQWTDTDSIYGARSLAEFWEQATYPALSVFPNALSSISLFVLLDLLGSSEPRIPSYFKTTHWAYKAMASLEAKLRQLRQFKSSPNHPSKRDGERQSDFKAEPLFLVEVDKPDSMFLTPYIGDDHVPFMARGVEVLHLIPTPFPRVWHRMEDDGEHLDLDTVEDWAKLVTAFAAEWMELEGFLANRSSGTSDTPLVGSATLHDRRIKHSEL